MIRLSLNFSLRTSLVILMNTFEMTPRCHCAHFSVVGGTRLFLTFSSSRSLSSPLCLLWRKALALPDLAILILASLVFWVWEEEVAASDKVGGKSKNMTNTLFNENLLTHCIGPSSVVIFTLTIIFLYSNNFTFILSHTRIELILIPLFNALDICTSQKRDVGLG